MQKAKCYAVELLECFKPKQQLGEGMNSKIMQVKKIMVDLSMDNYPLHLEYMI